MGLLTKLKSLLGLEDDRSQVRRGESGVTIEREPGESAEPDSETESAVKGVDTGTEESERTTESSGLTEVEEAEPVAPDATEREDAETDVSTGDATTEPDEAAESGEATELTADAEESESSTDADEAESATEETAEESRAEETTEEPAGEGEPLEDVKGIGAAYAERLRDAGVANVAELATADADRLAEETDLSAKRISRWIDRAKAR